MSIEHVLDELGTLRSGGGPVAAIEATTLTEGQIAEDYDSVCFFVAPIGIEGEVERKHSDMVLSSLVERALEPLKLKVIRADKITTPGMISKQIIEYLIRSRLVVVDLSFHNPNVFYELALRHVTGKPIIHLIRKADRIPFDVGNFRTIQIDDDDKYDLIAKLDTYRAEIANHVREVLEQAGSTDNPILTFYPTLKITLPDGQA